MIKALSLALILLISLHSNAAVKSESITHQKLSSLDDLKDKRIGVLQGSAHESYATSHYPNAKVLEFKSPADVLLAVKTNKVDAALYDAEPLREIFRENNAFALLGDPVFSFDVGVGFNKNNSGLKDRFNTFLAKIKAEGVYKDMVERWMVSGQTTIPAISANKTNGVLVVATSDVGIPFSVVKDNQLIGFDIELMKRFAASEGKDIKFSNMDFSSLIAAVSSNKADMIVSSIYVTDERKKQINFSDPYYVMATRVFALKENVTSQISITNTKLLSSLDDLKDKKIGVMLGSAHDTFAHKHYPDAQILQYKSLSDVLLGVKSQKVEVGIFADVTLKEILKTNPNLSVIGEPFEIMPVAFGFNKGNVELQKQFNEFFESIKVNGVYDDIINRWVKNGDTSMPEIATPNKNGILTAGHISDAGLPFVAVKDNKCIGLNIELAKRFAAHIGKDIRFNDMEFGSLIPAVATGKIDFIAVSLMITQERMQKINFATPYYKIGMSAFALKQNIANKEPINASPNLMANLGDLKDKKIGVMLGSTHDTFAHKHYPEAQILQYKSPSDVLLAVNTGKVNAGIYNSVSLKEILKTNPQIAVIGEPFENMPVAFGFKKSNVELQQQYNEFFKVIKANGVYDDMINRWTKVHDLNMPKIDTPNKNGLITAGHVSDGGLPFVIVKDNQNIGLNIELAKRFAAHIGKDIRFDDMEFGSLIPAVSTEKIDFIAVTLMITEERKQKINFGEPYYEIGMSAFALKKKILDATQPKDKEIKGPSFVQGVFDSFDSNIIQEKRYLLLWDGFKTTILISILATIFGTLLGSIICFMRMSKSALLYIPAKVYISVIRGTPVLVILMLIFYVVFGSVNINPVIVATIAFGMNFGAYVSEIFRSGIQGIDKGQTEAGIAMGFNKIKTFIYIILPQTIQRVLPVYKGEFISLVKMTSIVGFIAVQDLTKASDIIRSRTFDAFFPLIMIAILYFIISWALMLFLDYLEKVTDPKYKRKTGKTS